MEEHIDFSAPFYVAEFQADRAVINALPDEQRYAVERYASRHFQAGVQAGKARASNVFALLAA